MSYSNVGRATHSSDATRKTQPCPERIRRDTPRHWTPATWGLVHFCRGTPDPPPLDSHTVQAIRQEAFWDTVQHTPALQPLFPLLYRRLQQTEVWPAVPARTRDSLRGSYYASLLWGDRLAAALRPVLQAFEEQNVPVILLKGTALAAEIYENVALRPMVDVDLLVRPQDLSRARCVLDDLGYRLSPNPAGHPEQFDEEYGGEIELRRDDGQGLIVVDLHTHLIAIEWYRRATRLGDVEALWTDSRPLNGVGGEALQLSPEDTLIALCVHLAVPEAFASPIRRLLDVDWLIRRSDPPLDWDWLIARIKYFRVRMPVLVCLQMACGVYETPVPADVLAHLRAPVWRLTLVRRMANTQLEPMPQPVGRRARYLLQLLLVDDLQSLAAMLKYIFFPGRRWLKLRYTLQSPMQSVAYLVLHPVRVLGLGLASLWQARFTESEPIEDIKWN